jgi:ABC-type spermidine/putrescine transport system permease subunit II
MNEGLSVLVGMSVAYAASFLGMIVAYLSWRRRRRSQTGTDKEERHD